MHLSVNVLISLARDGLISVEESDTHQNNNLLLI